MAITVNQQLEKKLEHASAQIQMQIKASQRAIKELTPIAEHLGYVVNQETGEIAKIAKDAN